LAIPDSRSRSGVTHAFLLHEVEQLHNVSNVV
jgi:hypothetical protein